MAAKQTTQSKFAGTAAASTEEGEPTMSETTTTAKPAAATKRTRKAPATKPEVANTTDERKTFVCTAEGRGGKTNVRKFPQAMAFAVDVADDTAKTEAGRKGLVFRYFVDKAKAEAFSAKMNEAGYDAIVVAATSKEA
jgi:hypothetical protein